MDGQTDADAAIFRSHPRPTFRWLCRADCSCHFLSGTGATLPSLKLVHISLLFRVILLRHWLPGLLSLWLLSVAACPVPNLSIGFCVELKVKRNLIRRSSNSCTENTLTWGLLCAFIAFTLKQFLCSMWLGSWEPSAESFPCGPCISMVIRS